MPLNYPETVAEVLDSDIRFHRRALRAVRKLAHAKPWRGSVRQRLDKFRHCAIDLASAYDVTCPNVQIGVVDCYIPAAATIYLRRNCSVVSFLHEFAHVRGMDERDACRWSINLFRKVFPRSFERCSQRGHLLVANNQPATAETGN